MEENSKDKDEDGWLAPVTPAKLGCRSALGSSISSLEAKTGAVIQGNTINSSDANLAKLGCAGAQASSVSSLEAKTGAIQGRVMDSSDTNTAKLLGNSGIGLGFPCENSDCSGGVGARSVFTADHCNIGGGKPSQLGKSSCSRPQEPCAGADASCGRNSQSDFWREDFNFTPDSKESQKQRGRKRKSTGIDVNKKPRQRVKAKLHRPKILDASKPKKAPKEKTPKEKKMRKKAEKPEKIPKEKKGKKTRKNGSESEKTAGLELDPKTLRPHTPEPLAPPALTPTACEDITSEARNSASLSHHGTRVCRALNFNLEDPGDINKVVVGSVDDVNVAGRVDSSLDGMSVREGGGRNGHIFDTMMAALEIQEEEDFECCVGMRKVLQNYQRFDALHFPQILKKKRSKRQNKATTTKLNSSRTCGSRLLLSPSPVIRRKRSNRSKMQNLITKVGQGQSLTTEVNHTWVQNFPTQSQSHLVLQPEAPNVLPFEQPPEAPNVLLLPSESHSTLLPVPRDSHNTLLPVSVHNIPRDSHNTLLPVPVHNIPRDGHNTLPVHNFLPRDSRNTLPVHNFLPRDSRNTLLPVPVHNILPRDSHNTLLPLPVPVHNILPVAVPGDSHTILENLPHHTILENSQPNGMGINDAGFFHHLLPTVIDAPVMCCAHQDHHLLVPLAPITCCAHQVEQFHSLVVGEAELHHTPPPDLHSNHKIQQFQPGMHEHQLSQYQYQNQNQNASLWDNIELLVPQYQHVNNVNNWWMNMQPPLFQVPQVPPSFQVPQYQQVNNWLQPPLLEPSYNVLRRSDDATKNIDFIGQNGCLHRDDYMQDQCQSTSGPVVLHQKTSGPVVLHQKTRRKSALPLKKIKIKQRRPMHRRPRVHLDEETLQVWNRLMNIEEEEEKECGGKQKTHDEEKKEWWAKERGIFGKRVESLIARMHLIQGNRRFSQWKGSVVDSVVGVFLTQNVTDKLSSSAFMALASRFPVTPHAPNGGGGDENITYIQESVVDEDIASSQESVVDEVIASSQESAGSNIAVMDACTQDSMGSNLRLTNDAKTNDADNTELDINQEVEEKREGSSVTASDDILLSSVQDDEVEVNELDINQGVEEKEEKSSATASEDILLISMQDSPNQEISSCDCSTSQGFSYDISEEKVTSSTIFNSSNHHRGGKGKIETLRSTNEETTKILESETKSKKKKKKIKVKKKKKIPVNWDELRQNYSTNEPRSMSTMDSVDWNAVRNVSVSEFGTLIRGRGMHRTIAPRIKEFLDRLVVDHEKIDLEWLRNVPPDKVKDYLLSINGLGLKSVECVRLLSLQHHAFPVDTNVGRVAVRLGWVPLQPLPDNLQIDDLKKYPLVDSIQKYLWPRLCMLKQQTLYELHYQLITFGKVFCTMKQPNCTQCPLRPECRYFASASARGKFSLPEPQPQQKSTATAMNEENLASLTFPLVSYFNNVLKKSNYETRSSEYSVEFPQSPEPESRRQADGDIEDLHMQSGIDICILENDGALQEEPNEALKLTLTRLYEETNETESEILKSLDVISAEASNRKSKIISRLRIVHKVYELPDTHYLLQTFDKREVDDPCPYLLATSSSAGDSTNAVEEKNSNLVCATILIPCRTAMRGSFPLNGTYFQVNEVFVDDETSRCPIRISRSELCQFRRRALYCGTSATAIFKGLEAKEIQYCFWQGFICVRAFNRKTRAPKRLPSQFRPPGGPKRKNFKEEYEYDG